MGKGRNNYKIHEGQYGGLIIDLPTLLNEMLLKVFKDDQLIYQNRADKLLTKRYNPKNKYSQKAIVQIFKDLNSLTKMPKRTGNGKTTLLKESCCPTYYNDPEELITRLKVLVGSKEADNDAVTNEMWNVLD